MARIDQVAVSYPEGEYKQWPDERLVKDYINISVNGRIQAVA